MFSVADFVTTLGWVGAVAGAAAYLLVSRGRWKAASARYQSANLLGAGLMGGVAAFNGVWPSAAANLIWIVIGGQALWAIVAKKHADRQAAAASVSAADLEPRENPLVEATPLVAATSPAVERAEASYDLLLEERDPTLRMSVDELKALTGRGVAAAA
ncbi:CBU_0592 family membrane protein [Mumia sp. DW29H23]|uniref:CBU_0592 family membrane protein n=1 Tax=Mumia sp. DW29H23 TaxID=3421241 RepID=UPI003D69A9D2